MACTHYSRAYLHTVVGRDMPWAHAALTAHNVSYMQRLATGIREAIIDQRMPDFVRQMVKNHYPKGDVPAWIIEGCSLAGIEIEGIALSETL
jgi:tRNA-guanine family transglycosylase